MLRKPSACRDMIEAEKRGDAKAMKNFIEIMSRERIEKMIRSGELNEDDAVVSFCDTDKEPVDLGSTRAAQFVVRADDLDYEEICKRYGNDRSYFSEADDVAEFIIRAAAAGKRIVCQCEYGMSRSAGCAAAIYEFFMGAGIRVFADRKFCPSVVIFDQLYKALCRERLSITDIDVDAMRTGRALIPFTSEKKNEETTLWKIYGSVQKRNLKSGRKQVASASASL